MAIHILPPQLANQIAAGEVVERPASVVKELIENSLDADATKIEIDITQGGTKRIVIRDNGCGIGKDDLSLALARHATSKILTLNDLETIMSLGFRGEALASISSVSRLILTSCTASQQEGWQAYAEGRDMEVTLKPAAHPCGTTIEVLDLFYNTPARRKFLRTEKTEFSHIDEILRRIALVRFDVDFTLIHNGKKVRQYRAAHNDTQQESRLAAICGRVFLESALRLEWQHEGLGLKGWVAAPGKESETLSLQYCYVNGRMMKDRLINHAIRQAYQDKCATDYQPAFVLYLNIDPRQVDVNVHPAKHEVRFHQSRLVHDFIYQAVVQVLQQGLERVDVDSYGAATGQTDYYNIPVNRQAAGANIFADIAPIPAAKPTSELSSGTGSKTPYLSGQKIQRPPLEKYQAREGAIYQQLITTGKQQNRANTYHSQAKLIAPISSDNHSFGRVLTIVEQKFALVESTHGLALLALSQAEQLLRIFQLTPNDSPLKSQPLLIPVRVKATPKDVNVIRQYPELLQQMGLDLNVDAEQLILRAVPIPLRQQHLPKLIPEMLSAMAEIDNANLTAGWLAKWCATHSESKQGEWSTAQAITLLSELERLQPDLVRLLPDNLVQPISLDSYINLLSHDNANG